MVITSSAAEGTEVALPLIKLSQVLTKVTAALHDISIIHRPLAWEVSPWGGGLTEDLAAQIGALLC